MITITNLSKSYGEKKLFNNVSLSINKGEKIGLIGPNGAGKTTLFSLILGECEASQGKVHIHKNIRIGYLPQEASFDSKVTILKEVTEGNELIRKLLEEKNNLEANDKTTSAHYGDLLHRLENLGYFQLEYRAKKNLMGLGFKDKDFTKEVTGLSGGFRMRVLLAKLLTHNYDLLLLDEPTNYLDLGAALWLRDYLAGFGGTYMLISHDRDFLDQVTNNTLILENGALVKFGGNYEHYCQVRQEQRNYLLKQVKEQGKQQEKLLRFVERFHAQPNKASQVRAKRKALQRMEDILVPQLPQISIRNFHFPQTQESGQQVISLEKISKAYADVEVYKNFDFEVTRGERAVLVGENGAGKSTLLKILAGVINPDSGSRKTGYNVEIGYFSQTRLDVLNPHNTVLEEAFSSVKGSMTEEAVRTILGAFFFTGEDVYKTVSVLSGGEKSRLILAKLLINPPNFLLLDEPTTHLDVDAVEALIEALKAYKGTIVFISHDIHFVRSSANAVYEVKNGTVRKFPGNFDYYLEKKNQEKNIDEKVKYETATGKRTEGNQPALSNSGVQKDEEKIKNHNAILSNKIKKLQKDKKKLEAEYYVKERIIANRYSAHSEETKKEYALRLNEIKKIIAEINHAIQNLKAKFLE